jgi:hypothetical protein
MQIDGFIWFPDIVDKLAVKHNVCQDKAEDVFCNRPRYRFVEWTKPFLAKLNAFESAKSYELSVADFLRGSLQYTEVRVLGISSADPVVGSLFGLHIRIDSQMEDY